LPLARDLGTGGRSAAIMARKGRPSPDGGTRASWSEARDGSSRGALAMGRRIDDSLSVLGPSGSPGSTAAGTSR